MRTGERSSEPTLALLAAQWGRIGALGFGGPPSHVGLLRELCVVRRRWLSDEEFERALAAANMLPGPASTQLAIYCAWRLRGRAGALVGGVCFIAPGLLPILALSALFLSRSPPRWVRGMGLGAGAAVAAVAVRAGLDLTGSIWRRAPARRRADTVAYALGGVACAALAGGWLALVLAGCGAGALAGELRHRHAARPQGWRAPAVWPLSLALTNALAPARRLARGALAAAAPAAGAGALAWTALKVGALAFGGGFVIVPLMQSDAVDTYHWMTHAQFLEAVALGQLTPGPVTLTVASVGYAAAGIAGGLLASLVAFSPSFLIVLLGAGRFERLLDGWVARTFLLGAAPAAAGAIVGAAVPLTAALSQLWQFGVLAAAALALLPLRRGIVQTLLLAGLAGLLASLLSASVPR